MHHVRITIWSLGPKYTINSWKAANSVIDYYYDMKISEVNTRFSPWIKPELPTWAMHQHVLCLTSSPGSSPPETMHWAATTRQPVALTILYRHCTGGTKCFNCTPSSHSVCTIWTLLHRHWTENPSEKKCILGGISGFYSQLAISISLFPPAARCLNIFFHLRWRLWWIQILCFRWWLTMTSEENRYIYIYSSGLLTTCKYLANLPKNCMHTYASSLLCRQLSSACVSAINFLIALTKSIKL